MSYRVEIFDDSQRPLCDLYNPVLFLTRDSLRVTGGVEKHLQLQSSE